MKIRALGRVEYEAAWAQMRTFTDARNKDTEDELWIVEHPPVFTQGVAGKPEHLLFNPPNTPVVKTDRGGQITYHGPGQAMLYVLFDLKRGGYGVRELVIRIENAVISTLASYGVAAYGKRDAPGVYVRVASVDFRHTSDIEAPSPPAPLPGGEGGQPYCHSDSVAQSQAPNTNIGRPPLPPGEGWGEGKAVRNRNTALAPHRPAIPEDLKRYAREMRTGATDAEALMWHLLRGRRLQNLKFRRQHAVGRYILDFYCDELRLAVELDGGQHSERLSYDAVRTEALATHGIRVVRYWNNDVLSQTEGVLTDLFNAIEAMRSPFPSTPAPLPEGEGGQLRLQSVERINEPGPHASPGRPPLPPGEGWGEGNEARSPNPVSFAAEAGVAVPEQATEEAKIASLGLKIRNGCTYHGVAFNVDMDLTPFSFINPCGFEGLRVTHLHELGVEAPLDVAGMALALELKRQLSAPAK